MTRMSRIRCAIAAAALLGTLWAQDNAPPAPSPNGPNEPSATSEPPGSASAGASPSAADSTHLVVTKKVKANYPIEAAQGRLQGEVVVKIVVSETGDVESAEAVSGNPVLAKAAISAVKKWKFQPYIRDGKPRKVSTTFPFDFAFGDKITDNPSRDAISTDIPPGKDAQDPGAGTTKRIQVDQGITQGLVLHRVAPIYPPAARETGIQGTVVLAAIISKEGKIEDLRVISGPSALRDAAIGAVQQWRYRPYIFAGEPVEIDTQIVVNFTIGER